MEARDSWPVVYADKLLIGDPESSLAVCCLWTMQDIVRTKISLEKISLLGNLYSAGGVEPMVRNVLAHPRIRAIVLAGADTTKTGEALLAFHKQGVIADEKLGWITPLPRGINEDDLLPGERRIDAAITLAAINLFREKVSVHDFRGNDRWDEAAAFIQNYRNELPFLEKALVFPVTKPDIKILMGETVASVFRGAKLEQVWLSILQKVMKFGHISEEEKTQELLTVIAVLGKGTEDVDRLPAWIGHSRESLLEYAEKIIKGEPSGDGLAYEYGPRIKDQTEEVIRRLRENPHTRQLYVDVWDREVDFFPRLKDPPCMTSLWFKFHNGKLYSECSFRSHDIYSAWLRNAVAVRLLSTYVAKESELPLGETTIVSRSAHIYDEKRFVVAQLLQNHPRRHELRLDPVGNFVIGIEGGQVVARLENKSGAIIDFKGTTAREIYESVLETNAVSDIGHAVYLGVELERAARCLAEGKDYIQEAA